MREDIILSEMKEKILDKKLIPVAVINDVSQALPLAEALLAADLQVIEITENS